MQVVRLTLRINQDGAKDRIAAAKRAVLYDHTVARIFDGAEDSIG
jgi:hypothetical protein